MANIHTIDQYLSPLRYFLIITASKSLQSTEISLYLAFTNELNVAQKEKNIDE
jgi:hypothetical protein